MNLHCFQRFSTTPWSSPDLRITINRACACAFPWIVYSSFLVLQLLAFENLPFARLVNKKNESAIASEILVFCSVVLLPYVHVIVALAPRRAEQVSFGRMVLISIIAAFLVFVLLPWTLIS